MSRAVISCPAGLKSHEEHFILEEGGKLNCPLVYKAKPVADSFNSQHRRLFIHQHVVLRVLRKNSRGRTRRPKQRRASAPVS